MLKREDAKKRSKIEFRTIKSKARLIVDEKVEKKRWAYHEMWSKRILVAERRRITHAFQAIRAAKWITSRIAEREGIPKGEERNALVNALKEVHQAERAAAAKNVEAAEVSSTPNAVEY